jgi:hypothetical protein
MFYISVECMIQFGVFNQRIQPSLVRTEYVIRIVHLVAVEHYKFGSTLHSNAYENADSVLRACDCATVLMHRIVMLNIKNYVGNN